MSTGAPVLEPDRKVREIEFSTRRGDRAPKTFEDALALAVRRAPSRGRQQVRRKLGTITGNSYWYVQDIR